MIIPRPHKPSEITVSKADQKLIREAAVVIHDKYLIHFDGSYRLPVDNPRFHQNVSYEAAKAIPEQLYSQIASFSTAVSYTDYGAVAIRGLFDVRQERLGATPINWSQGQLNRSPSTNELTEYQQELSLMEIVSFLIHSVIGSYPMEFLVQRNGGGYCHLVIPDQRLADTQTGSGFKTDLTLHTEDAALNTSAEYISLMCVRNFEEAESFLYSLRSTDWEALEGLEHKLRQKMFTLPPDGNYSYDPEFIQFLSENGEVPVLFGNPLYPWFRVDYVEMHGKQATVEAEEAIVAFRQEIENSTISVKMEAGDFLMMNNRMVAHGRAKFNAGIDPAGNSVERRIMLRTLGHSSLLAGFEYCHSENIRLNGEFTCGHALKTLEEEYNIKRI